MNMNIFPMVRALVHLFERGTRKNIIVLYPKKVHKSVIAGIQLCLHVKAAVMAQWLELEWLHLVTRGDATTSWIRGARGVR